MGGEAVFAFRSSHVVALAAALACSACQAGGWHLTGTNDVNLGAMVADPMDLVSGRGAPGSDGQEAASAVARLRLDRVKPLQVETLTSSVGSSSSSGSSGGGGASGY
jgi:uncharacterized membrane protein YgcG